MKRAVFAAWLSLGGCAPSALRDAQHVPDTRCEADGADKLRATPLAADTRLTIDNGVAACTSFALKELYGLGEVIVGVFAVQELDSRGKCGCMSSEIAYRVFETVEVAGGGDGPSEKVEYQRAAGVVNPKGESAALVIATDPSFVDKPLTLKVRCEGPD